MSRTKKIMKTREIKKKHWSEMKPEDFKIFSTRFGNQRKAMAELKVKRRRAEKRQLPSRPDIGLD